MREVLLSLLQKIKVNKTKGHRDYLYKVIFNKGHNRDLYLIYSIMVVNSYVEGMSGTSPKSSRLLTNLIVS